MKKLTGIFLAVCMLLSLSALPAAAHQDFSDGTDFETFTTTYNKDDPDTYNGWGQRIHETPNGYMTQREEQNAGNGAYAAGPAGSKYGKALKIYQGHVDGSGVYGGVTYWFNEKLYDTFYFEGSFYAENAIPRVLRLYGDKGSTSISSLYFTKSNTIELFGNSTGGKRYELNKWYDVKMWYNMNEKIYRVTITCDGELVLNQTGEDKNSVQLEYINKIEFFNSITCKNLTEDSYCYWDNVKAETSFSYSPKRGIADDFEDYVSDEPSTPPRNPGNTIFNYSLNYQQQGTDGVVSDNTAGKGTSAKLMAEKQTYPTLGADMKTPIPAMDARFSIKVPELNGNSRVIYLSLVKTDEVTSAPQLTAMQFSTSGTIDVGGKSYPYEINKWYDVRIIYVSETKTEEYWVWDDSGSLIAHDTYTHDKTIVSNVRRLMFRMTNNPKALERCHYWIDNLKIIEPARENAESFKVNYAESTTGPEINVKKDDDVIIKFNNKLAAAETPEVLKGKLALNFGKGTIDSVERVDDYTLKVNFEKQSGKHYHVSFDGITDENGLTLTDYIEFDTHMQDTLLGNVSFLRDGNILTLLTPGEVTASFKAEAHNGVTLNVMHTLALYCDGRLSQVRTETISANNGESTSELSLTVPDDGKTYVVKSLRWDSVTLAPFGAAAILKPTTDLPIVLLKLDDFGYSSRLPVFESVKDWVVENELKASFGLMGYTLGENNATPGEKARIKAINDNPRIEVWSHGYDWRSGKFKNGTVVNGDTLLDTKDPVTTTTETQRAEFTAVFETSDRYGIDIKAFNPPSNDMDEATVQLLDNEFKKIKTVMLIANSLPSYLEGKHNFTPLYKSLKMEEGGTGCTRAVEDLKASWETAKTNGSEYVMLQSHPYGWKDYDGAEARFKEFVLWLKAQGAMFMTPSEYTAYAAEVK